MDSSFSISEAFSYGWDTFKKNQPLLVRLFIVLLCIVVISNTPNLFRDTEMFSIISPVLSLMMLILQFIFSAGFIAIMVLIIRQKNPTFSNILTSRRNITQYVLGSLIVAMLFVVLFAIIFLVSSPTGFEEIGWSLFIIGMIVVPIVITFVVLILFPFFGFWYFGIFDKTMSAIEGYKYSLKITKGSRLKIVQLEFVMLILVIIALTASSVLGGILMSMFSNFKFAFYIPFIIIGYLGSNLISLTFTYIYKKLDAQYQAKEGSVAHEDTVHVQNETVTEVEIQPQEITAPLAEETN